MTDGNGHERVYTRADVLNEDMVISHLGMIELLKVPVSDWNDAECKQAIGCIQGLLLARYLNDSSEGKDIPNDEMADYMCAIADIGERVKEVNGHYHPEDMWRPNLQLQLESVDPRVLWSHKT